MLGSAFALSVLACGPSSQRGASVSRGGTLDGIWIPADGVWMPASDEACRPEHRQEALESSGACNVEQPRFGWQYPTPVSFRGDLVTIHLIWATGSLGPVVGRPSGFYTVPFRERSVDGCDGSVLEFRNPRGSVWTPFIRVADGELREMAEFGCRALMVRAVGEQVQDWPRPLQQPPRPYFETGEFVEDPRDGGFEGIE